MEDGTPELPQGQTYSSYEPGIEDIRPHHGEHLLKLAEATNDTVEAMYQKAIDRSNLDRKGINEGELDRELVNLMARDVPEAIEDLGEEIEKARELEQMIGQGSLEKQSNENEIEDFLSRYREAEGLYREVFQRLGKPVNGQPMAEYLSERYRLDTLDCVGDIPEPRPDFR